ncbi:lanthionine synthetase C family protein [Actinoplanes aureus]|uniref:Lanthionine synthetase C family protein n=1 Tax=Actinoplanes aureus TaxID=2792083 RepID=A0A931CFW3_9ACTN|nr:lanthionine synthetase C family protein [Actinoplanes aureus]MBG0569150.1 lanthionine synthetase C family protein [Actinoplanes aureus]
MTATTTPVAAKLGPLLTAAADQLADPAIVRIADDWRTLPPSLAGGAAGIALFHLERAASGHGDVAVARRWVRAAVDFPISVGPNANLFYGVPTLALLLHIAAPAIGGCQRTLTTLDNRTSALTRDRLDAAYARIDRGDPLPMREFDLVHGLTGLGAYHLHRHPDHPITHDVLTYLARITEPLDQHSNRPPWWLHSGLGGLPDPRFPHGHANLGAAHGMSAVIALLSLAVLAGQQPPGVLEALTRLCDWTDQHQHEDDTAGGPWWPGYVTDDPGPPRRHRPSWCYGTAGAARAQQLAGHALNDSLRHRRAEAAMLASLRAPNQRAALPEGSLCHGKAGLLQATWRTIATSTNPHLAEQLASELPLLADDVARQLAATPPDSPELMDGTAGIALALHTAHTNACVTTWDAFLLLA